MGCIILSSDEDIYLLIIHKLTHGLSHHSTSMFASLSSVHHTFVLGLYQCGLLYILWCPDSDCVNTEKIVNWSTENG